MIEKSSYRLFTVVVLLSIVCLTACSKNAERDRKVIATVNGEVIYLDEYEKRLSVQKGALSPKAFAQSLNKRELLEEEILDSMITEKIILLRAKTLNLKVSDKDLEQKILDIRKDYGDNFFELLAAQNVDYNEWREELRKEMLFDKLIAADVNASVHISDVEVEDAYHENPRQCNIEAHVRAAQIVVRDAAKAKDVKKRLDGGEPFEKVAAETSIGPEAARGGDLGLVTRQTMPEPIDKVLFQLPKGKISGIIKSDYGYHILKVEDRLPARMRSFSECREDLLAAIRARKEEAAFAAWLDNLRFGASVQKEKDFRKLRGKK